MAYPRDKEKAERFAAFLSFQIKENKYKSQIEFAEAAGISGASVSRMLRAIQYPDVATLKKIAPAIGKTVNELMVIAEYMEEGSSTLPQTG